MPSVGFFAGIHMTTSILDVPGKTLADVLHELGDISPDRIRMPVGTATEQDVIEARPDVPAGVVVLDRPPAERDQSRKQPVEQPRRQVPDRLLHAAPVAQWCISARYLS